MSSQQVFEAGLCWFQPPSWQALGRVKSKTKGSKSCGFLLLYMYISFVSIKELQVLVSHDRERSSPRLWARLLGSSLAAIGWSLSYDSPAAIPSSFPRESLHVIAKSRKSPLQNTSLLLSDSLHTVTSPQISVYALLSHAQHERFDSLLYFFVRPDESNALPRRKNYFFRHQNLISRSSRPLGYHATSSTEFSKTVVHRSLYHLRYSIRDHFGWIAQSRHGKSLLGLFESDCHTV